MRESPHGVARAAIQMTPLGLEPRTYGLTSHFDFRRPTDVGSWAGLCLRLHPQWSGARRRVSTPSRDRGLGSALASQRSPNLTGFTRAVSGAVLHAEVRCSN